MAGALLLGCAELAFPTTAFGQGAPVDASASGLEAAAKEALSEDRVPEACRLLKEATRFTRRVEIAFKLAKCHLVQGLARTAGRELDEVRQRAASEGNQAIVAEASTLLASIGAKGPNLLVEVSGSDQARREVTVLIDGVELARESWGTPQLADAGQHVVLFRTPLFEYKNPVDLSAGQTLPVRRSFGRARFTWALPLDDMAILLDDIPIVDGKKLLDGEVTLLTGAHDIQAWPRFYASIGTHPDIRRWAVTQGARPAGEHFTVSESGPPVSVPVGRPRDIPDIELSECRRTCTEFGQRCAASHDPPKCEDDPAVVGLTLGAALVGSVGAISGFVLIGASIARAINSATHGGIDASARTVQINSMWTTIVAGGVGLPLILGGVIVNARNHRAEPARVTARLRLAPLLGDRAAGLGLVGTF